MPKDTLKIENPQNQAAQSDYSHRLPNSKPSQVITMPVFIKTIAESILFKAANQGVRCGKTLSLAHEPSFHQPWKLTLHFFNVNNSNFYKGNRKAENLAANTRRPYPIAGRDAGAGVRPGFCRISGSDGLGRRPDSAAVLLTWKQAGSE